MTLKELENEIYYIENYTTHNMLPDNKKKCLVKNIDIYYTKIKEKKQELDNKIKNLEKSLNIASETIANLKKKYNIK